MTWVTNHFAVRVRERIGDIDPVLLWENLSRAIAEGRDDFVEYRGRQRNKNQRVFRFRVPDGRAFDVVVDTEEMALITVLFAEEFAA